MTDVSRLLAETRTVVLVDWPSREVPDTLARRGFTVIASEGAETYTAYEAEGNEVRTRSVDRLPQSAELVYAYRPIDELPDIVQMATAVGATTVWLHAEGDLAPADATRARELVERAGLVFVAGPSIVDAARAFR
jgi:predicted CoA-binding protein